MYLNTYIYIYITWLSSMKIVWIQRTNSGVPQFLKCNHVTLEIENTLSLKSCVCMHVLYLIFLCKNAWEARNIMIFHQEDVQVDDVLHARKFKGVVSTLKIKHSPKIIEEYFNSVNFYLWHYIMYLLIVIIIWKRVSFKRGLKKL